LDLTQTTRQHSVSLLAPGSDALHLERIDLLRAVWLSDVSEVIRSKHSDLRHCESAGRTCTECDVSIDEVDNRVHGVYLGQMLAKYLDGETDAEILGQRSFVVVAKIGGRIR
jgi:hypothetical protein